MPAFSPRRRLPALGLTLLLLLALSGCASIIYTDPGPNPARLEVPAQGQISKAQVDHYVAMFGGPEFLNTAPRYHTLDGPFWDVQAFILAPDGAMHQLPPAPGSEIHEKPGMKLDGQTQFLCPPGQHRVRIMVSGAMLHTFYDAFGQWKEWITLYHQEAEMDLNLCAGCLLRQEDLKR